MFTLLIRGEAEWRLLDACLCALRHNDGGCCHLSLGSVRL